MQYIGELSGSIATLIIFASFLVGYSGIVIYVSKYSPSKYTRWLIFLLFYFLIVGYSYGQFNPNFRGGDFMWIVGQDMRFIMYVIIASIFANRRYIFVYHQIMRFLGIFSIILAFFSILFFDFNIDLIISRKGNLWSFSYYSWWLSVSIVHYWGHYSLIVKKDRTIGLAVLISYLLLGILFLKRAAVINVAVIIIIAGILNNRKKITAKIKWIFSLLITLGIAALIVLLINSENLYKLINANFERYGDLQEVEEIDRVAEWDAYKNSASSKQLALGNGVGHYPELQLGNSYLFTKKINALHIGYFNVFFKGGILLSILYLVIFFRILRKFLKRRSLKDFDLVCLGVSLSALFYMFYEGSWGYTLVPIGTYPAIFYLLSSKSSFSKS